MSIQAVYDTWADVERAASGRGGAPALRLALAEMQAAALDAIIEHAQDRDDRQTQAEVLAVAHPSGRNGCPGDRLGGCHNHRAHNAWAFQRNQAMYASADARKAAQFR